MRAETEAWLDSAESDAGAARVLLTNGFYSQAVFYTHLSVEKVLKAVVVERSDGGVRHTHDLMALMSSASDERPQWLLVHLAKLSIQSTASRYTLPPASSRYTRDLAAELLEGSQEAIRWLKQQLT